MIEVAFAENTSLELGSSGTGNHCTQITNCAGIRAVIFV